jgi:hypothetical protein
MLLLKMAFTIGNDKHQNFNLQSTGTMHDILPPHQNGDIQNVKLH